MKQIFILSATLCLFGCASLELQPADFSWPVESVLTADAKGMVSEPRFAVSFSIVELVTKELGETQHAAGVTVRVIRDREGFYYITAPHFKNVYVFTAGDGVLSKHRVVEIGESAMSDPKFNQRDTFIELINGSANIHITKDGILEGEKK
jgi:hypothetical protein